MMVITVVIYVYVMYNLSLHYSDTDINNGNQQFDVDKKLRRLRCALVVLFALRRSLVARIHHLCQSMRRRLKGVSVYVMNI